MSRKTAKAEFGGYYFECKNTRCQLGRRSRDYGSQEDMEAGEKEHHRSSYMPGYGHEGGYHQCKEFQRYVCLDGEWRPCGEGSYSGNSAIRIECAWDPLTAIRHRLLRKR